MFQGFIANVLQNPVAWIALAISIWSVYSRHLLTKVSVDRRVKFDYIFWKLKTFNDLLFQSANEVSSAIVMNGRQPQNHIESLLELTRSVFVAISCIRFLLSPENFEKVEAVQIRYEALRSGQCNIEQCVELLDDLNVIIRSEMEAAAAVLKEIDSQQPVNWS